MSRLAAWFRPTLLGLHAFALVAVGFCVAMGLWQLGVYDARQVDAVTERESNAPVSLTSVWGADDAFSSDLSALPVTITGRFASANQQFGVTPRLQGGVEGAWLVAPVLVDGTDSALLVVRGWSLAVGALPEVPVGEVTLTGVLQQGDSGSGAFEPNTRTIGSIRLPILINEVPFDLFSGYAVSSDPSMSAGLAVAEVPSSDVSWTAGSRNLAYALQWWVFGAFALFMWWRMASESVAASRPKVI